MIRPFSLPLATSLLILFPEALAQAASPPLRVAAEGLDPFDAEVLRTFARTQDRAMETIAGPRLASGRGAAAEISAGCYRDAVQADAATAEVFPSRLVALTRWPNPRAKAIESLRWSRVGALRDSRARAVLHDAKVSGAEVSEYATVEEALAALRDGTVSAALLELPEALLAHARDPQLEFGVFLGGRRSRVYVVRPGEGALRARLDAFLRSLRSTPSWTAMITRHYGSSALELLAQAHLRD